MSKYKLIVSDLDETLLGSDHKISDRNAEAIQEAHSQGVKFVPATGRNYKSVQPMLSRLGLAGEKDEYLIAYNGGAVFENAGNRLLLFEDLPFEAADALYRRGREYEACVHVYTLEDVYVYNLWDEERRYMKGLMSLIETDAPDLGFLRGQKILKVLYENENLPYLHKIEKELQEDFGTQVDMAYSGNRSLEFTRKGVTKGAALMQLADRLGIPIENVIAVGDNLNDLSMLQAAGIGIAVANAAPGAKAGADITAPWTNDEDAVARILEKYVLD
ncbi:MAG: HAD family phosphatase [Clostridia bacterium]|nr:HAD family phosphatase [Clostridia bacterium]